MSMRNAVINMQMRVCLIISITSVRSVEREGEDVHHHRHELAASLSKFL